MGATRIKSLLLNFALAACVVLPALIFVDNKEGFFLFCYKYQKLKLALSLLLPFFAALLCFFKTKNARPASVLMLFIQPVFVLFTVSFKNRYIHYSLSFMQYHYAYALLAFFSVLLAAALAFRMKKLTAGDFELFCKRFFTGYAFVFVYLFANLYFLQRANVSDGSLNLIPFSGEIRRTLLSLPSADLLVRSAGNVFFYTSFVLLLSSLPGKKIRGGATLLLFCVPLAASVFCEALQYFTGIGNADVDDVILNTIGILIGFPAVKIISKTSEE